MRLQTRIAELEAAPRKSRGFRHFYTFDNQTFYLNESDLPDGTFDYHAAIRGGNGTPEPGAQAFSQEHLDGLAAEGWSIVTIWWADMGSSETTPDTD